MGSLNYTNSIMDTTTMSHFQLLFTLIKIYMMEFKGDLGESSISFHYLVLIHLLIAECWCFSCRIKVHTVKVHAATAFYTCYFFRRDIIHTLDMLYHFIKTTANFFINLRAGLLYNILAT